MNRPQAQEKREEGEEDGRDFNNRRKREIEALIGVFKRSDLLVSLRVKSLLNFDSKKGDEISAKIYADWRVKVASGARDFFVLEIGQFESLEPG